MNKKLLSDLMTELGSRTSPKKAAAARRNGKLGGHPSKFRKNSAKKTSRVSPGGDHAGL
jgi:hypothetical protein